MVASSILLPLADNDFGHMGDWGAGWWILMMVGMVLFWGLVIVGIVWVVRELGGRRDHAEASASPLDLLDRRLAEGGISPEEYEERRRILSREPRSGSP
jgi:putative membrane protein